MPHGVESCPHCGEAVDVERSGFVEDGLLVCEHCGELFAHRAGDGGPPHTIDMLYGKPAPAAIRVSPDDALGRRPAASMDHAGHPAAISTPSGRRGAFATWAWSIGILVLLFALAGQFAWHLRDEFARHAPLRPWLVEICRYAGCEIPLLRAPAQIRVVARDVRRHPDERDALRVSLTFANEAAFEQAWPRVQLTFFDMRDRVLAQRSFTPEEYLPQNIDMAAGMPAHGALQTFIDVIDPGPDAVNFTFEFR